MAKDEIDRAARAGADDVAGASKQQEVAALLKKMKVAAEAEAKADAATENSEATTSSEATSEAQTTAAADSIFASDAAYDVAAAGMAAADAGESEGGLSTGTLLAIGGVALVAGGIAIAANNDDDSNGGDDTPPPPPPPIELDLTPQADEIDLTASTGADVIRGVVDPLELNVNDETTFSNGDIIQGNGQTIVRLFVDSGSNGTQPADVVRMSDVATVELFAQTTGTVILPAASWDNVGEIAYVGGIGGMGVLALTLDNGVDMSIADNINGGFIGASYTTNLYAEVGNSGQGGASISFGTDNLADLAVDVAQVSNSGYMYVSNVGPGAVTAGDMTGTAVDGGALDISASVSGDLTVGDISLSFADSGSADVTLDTGGDLTVGNIDVTGGDAMSVEIDFADNFGDITIGNVSVEVGNTGSVDANFEAESGDLLVGDVSIVGGDNASAFPDFTAGSSSGVGSVTVGDVVVALGDYTDTVNFGATSFVPASVQFTAADNITAGDISLSVGDALESATLSATISVSAGTAGNGGNISLGDVSLVAGDNANASVTIGFSTSGTDITVGDVTVAVGDRLSLVAGNTTPSAYLNITNTSALAGADITVGNVSLAAGLSGTIDAQISLSGTGTPTQTGALGSLTVGNLSLTAGQNTLGDVEIYHQQSASGDLGMGDLTVGDIDVSLGQDATVSISISQELSGSAADTAASMGDFTVGGLTATMGIGADLDYYLYAYNNAATAAATGNTNDLGAITVGDVSIAGDDAASVSIIYSFSATSGSVDSVTIGDIAVSVGVGGSIDLDLEVQGASLGDVAIGDIAMTLGQSASGDFGNSISISATDGDIGSVTIGDMSMTLDEAASWSDFAVYVYAAGNIESVAIGELNVDLAASAVWGSYNHFSVSATKDIGAVSFGDISVELDAGAYVTATGGLVNDDAIDRNVYGRDIDTLNFGGVSLLAHGVTSALSVDLSATASGDIGAVSVGDISLIADDTTTAPLNVQVNVAALAGSVSNIDVGNVLLSYTTASTGGVTFSLAETAVTGADVSIGGLTLDFTAVGTTGAAAVEYYSFTVDSDVVAANGDGDVTIGLIDVNVTLSSTNVAGAVAEEGLMNLTNILAGVNAGTGDIYLGTVDYSDYVYAGTLVNPTLTIDVSSYLGNISVIGSDGVDFIDGNAGVNTMTGNDGADFFDVNNGQGALTAAGADKIVDFVHNVDTLSLDISVVSITANEYSEGTYADFAAFLADANARGVDADPDYLVAGQVGTSVFIAVNSNQAGDAEYVVELQNASIGTLDFGDYNFY